LVLLTFKQITIKSELKLFNFKKTGKRDVQDDLDKIE